MGELATKCRNLKVQLQFENEQEEKIAQSKVVDVKLANSIDPNSEVEPIYPSILQILQDQIDELKVTSVAGGTANFTGDTLTISLKNKNNIEVAQLQTTIPMSEKVDKVAGYGLSKNDFTDALKNKLNGIEGGAQVNILEGVKVNGVELTITDKKVNIDLSAYALETYVNEELAKKQDKLPTKVNGKFLHINNTSGEYEWGNVSQDLTANALCELDTSDWECLKNNGNGQLPTQLEGLDNSYDFIKIKLSINSNNYTALLVKNSVNHYVGVFDVEEEDYLYEIALDFKSNDNMLQMKCSRFDLIPITALYDADYNLLVDSNNSLIITTEV